MNKHFWSFDKKFFDSTLLIDADNDITLTYKEADEISNRIAARLPSEKKLAFLFCKNDYKTLR